MSFYHETGLPCFSTHLVLKPRYFNVIRGGLTWKRHYYIIDRWCGPCKTLGPKIEEAVEKHAGELLLAKVDIDDNAEIAMKYKVPVSFCFF